jgi:3-isopropylmalate dehydrogenase
MLSAALLLGWLGDRHADPEASAAARLIERAVADTIAEGVRTRDLGGTEGTSGFAAAVTRTVRATGETVEHRSDQDPGAAPTP